MKICVLFGSDFQHEGNLFTVQLPVAPLRGVVFGFPPEPRTWGDVARAGARPSQHHYRSTVFFKQELEMFCAALPFNSTGIRLLGDSSDSNPNSGGKLGSQQKEIPLRRAKPNGSLAAAEVSPLGENRIVHNLASA